MAYRTTVRADDDVITVYLHGVQNFGIEQAERYLSGLVKCFELLAEQPRIARERPELRPPVRLYFHGAHVIAYVIQGDDILVIRVLHGRQDWERHLGP